MTNELEKTFFDTFGIEPYDRYLNCTENLEVDCNRNCNCCDKAEDVYCYPEISNRILLELICIVLNTFQTFEVYRIMDIDSLKEKILKLLMLAKYEVYSQVRTLFEEG
jgi:hypothetical protein